MTDKEAEFIVKSLKKLQEQINGLEKTIKQQEKRIRELEPPSNEDEIIVRNARGQLEIYLIRNEEGKYIDPRDDRTEH